MDIKLKTRCDRPGLRNIPIVFLPGKGQQLALFSPAVDRAEAYVSKPWQPRELLATLKKVLLYANIKFDRASADAGTEYKMKKLEITKPCKVCDYYGKDGINCAVHPAGRPQ